MKQVLIIILLIVLISCEEEINPSLDIQNTELLVVQGVLTNENISHEIRLSRPYQDINGSPTPVSGANVVIVEGDNFYPLIENPSSSGIYQSNPFRAVFGRVYFLSIEVDGQTYFAGDASDPVEPLDSLEIVRKDDGMYELVLNESGVDPNYISYEINWQSSSSCNSGEACQGEIIYYDLKTVDVHELYKPEKSSFLFPANSTIIRRKYSVNTRYRDYLRSILSETEWRGGLFDVQRENPVGNLSEGAIGFFAVSTVVSDTTLLSQ